MHRHVISVFIAIVIATLSGAVHAAPQMLGIVASTTPVKLNCEGNVCRAEIASFCLQAERDPPAWHQRYTAHDASVFQVVARTESGEQVRLPLNHVHFRSERGYTAVDVSFDARELEMKNLHPVALDVAEGGLLIPEPMTGDPDPIKAHEIADALAYLRPTADKVFATRVEDYEAIRLVNILVNQTPKMGRLAKNSRTTLWQDTFGESPDDADRAGGKRAVGILGTCESRTEQGRFVSIRRCLEHRMDDMLMELNNDYWRAVQPGW